MIFLTGEPDSFPVGDSGMVASPGSWLTRDVIAAAGCTREKWEGERKRENCSRGEGARRWSERYGSREGDSSHLLRKTPLLSNAHLEMEKKRRATYIAGTRHIVLQREGREGRKERREPGERYNEGRLLWPPRLILLQLFLLCSTARYNFPELEREGGGRQRTDVKNRL